MGVIKQGILGGFSGRVANIVGSSWKGIAVIKSRPLSVANPNTAGQQLQRGKMRQIVADARILLAALIQPFWNPFAQGESGYNSFVSENIASYDANGISVPADMYMARGSLLGVPDATGAASAAGNDVDITWTDNSGQADALATDEVEVVYYNSTQDYWVVDTGNAVRSAAALNIVDNLVAQNDDLYVYIFASRPDRSKVSDSVYDNVIAAA
jgi:hypothetical protein